MRIAARDGATGGNAKPQTSARALAEPFDIAGHHITVSGSVGIAFAGPGQDIPEELLRDADFAMYQAKHNGGGRHQVLDPAARFAADRRSDIERHLRQAEARSQLALLYQPILDIATHEVRPVEALLRWRHPVRGIVMPDVVIPCAERTGLIALSGNGCCARPVRISGAGKLPAWPCRRSR